LFYDSRILIGKKVENPELNLRFALLHKYARHLLIEKFVIDL